MADLLSYYQPTALRSEADLLQALKFCRAASKLDRHDLRLGLKLLWVEWTIADYRETYGGASLAV